MYEKIPSLFIFHFSLFIKFKECQVNTTAKCCFFDKIQDSDYNGDAKKT